MPRKHYLVDVFYWLLIVVAIVLAMEAIWFPVRWLIDRDRYLRFPPSPPANAGIGRANGAASSPITFRI